VDPKVLAREADGSHYLAVGPGKCAVHGLYRDARHDVLGEPVDAGADASNAMLLSR
jgi:hypothetical protein